MRGSLKYSKKHFYRAFLPKLINGIEKRPLKDQKPSFLI